MRNPLLPFPLGAITLTEGAAALQSTKQSPEQLLARHIFGDWGELTRRIGNATITLWKRASSPFSLSFAETTPKSG